jgi:cyanamide hydratase family protein with HD domain
MRLADVMIPDTAATRGALEVATAYFSAAVLNHSMRSYLLGAAYGAMNDVAFDAELLYVTSMLHDIGMVKAFDSHTLPFEEAGGHVAWVFGAGAGWPIERRVRASEVIVRHMWNKMDVSKDPEGNLLDLGAGLDIAGRRLNEIPAQLLAEVTERYPRLGLSEEFAACFRDQAERKPDSLGAAFVHAGVAERIEANPLDR